MSFQRSSRTSPQAVRAAMIEAAAVKLRMLGHSYDEISLELSKQFTTTITAKLAHQAVRRALAKAKAESTESAKEMRDIELYRLDHLFYHSMLHVRAGDRQAIGDAVKVMDRRAKLLGLDAPTKVEATVSQQTTDLKNLTSEQLLELEALVGQAATSEHNEGADYANLEEEVEYPDEGSSEHPTT